MRKVSFFSKGGVAILAALTAGFCMAAEIRTWTSIDGRTLEGKLVRIDGDSVIIQNKDGKQLDVKKTSLSRGDLDYLKDFGGDEEKPSMLDNTSKKDQKVTLPSKEVKIDRKAFKERTEPFKTFGVSLKVLETPHFLICHSDKVKPADTGEHAERIWHEMNFQHPTFGQKFSEGKKMAVVVIDNKEDWMYLGKWYEQYLRDQSQGDAADELKATWPESAASVIYADAQMMADNNIIPRVQCVWAKDKKMFDGVWSPFRTHLLFVACLDAQMGGVSGFGAKGHFAFTRGFGYYKEIQLTGTTETSLVVYNDDTARDKEVDSVGGFEDGKKWPDILQKLIKKNKMQTSIETLYQLNARSMSKEQCVAMYSFSRYLQSTPERLAIYAQLIERIETGSQIPEPVEVAKLYGFDTVEAFEADWKAYIVSKEFK